MKRITKIILVGLFSLPLFFIVIPSFAKDTVVAQRGGGHRGGGQRGGGHRGSDQRSRDQHRGSRDRQYENRGAHHGVHQRHVSRSVHVNRHYRLPVGCITTVVLGGINYYRCGGVYYRPYYEGTTVVYVVHTP